VDRAAFVTYLVVSFLIAFFAAAYVTWTLGRLQRLHDRCAAARASLDAQLVRRAAAAAALARDHNGALGERAGLLYSAAQTALHTGADGREVAENDLTRELRHLPWSGADPALADVVEAAGRMTLARHIYNDAVRDTVALRGRRMPRALRLCASRPVPTYFDIDDTPPGRP
jgi:hypothetical protein